MDVCVWMCGCGCGGGGVEPQSVIDLTDLLDFGDVELQEHLEVELQYLLDDVGLIRCTRMAGCNAI